MIPGAQQPGDWEPQGEAPDSSQPGPALLLPLEAAEQGYVGWRRVCGAAEMRRIDLAAVQAGVLAELLMENAGRAVASAALRWLTAARRAPSSDRPAARVLVLCGPGNNGGDGYCAARTLHQHGALVTLAPVGRPAPLEGCAPELRLQMELCAALVQRSALALRPLWAEPGADPRSDELEDLGQWFRGFDLLIDALFGTGLKRPLAKPYAPLLEAVARSGRPVLAVDLPSGLDADDGRLWGPAPRCVGTVTFGAWKHGLCSAAGRALSGPVEVAEIGLPRVLIEGLAALDSAREGPGFSAD